MSGLSFTLMLQLFGALFILMGLAGHLGLYKAWYWNSPNRIYGYVPIGVVFIVSSLEADLRAKLGQLDWMVVGLYVILFGLALWWFIKPPKFIKPGWIRLIEAASKRDYQVMVQDVKAGMDWHKRVATPEVLAEWIKEAHRRPLKPSK